MMGRLQHTQPRATAAAHVTERGGPGGRAWALRDPSSGRIASAKRFPRLLEFRGTYEVEPTLTSRGRATR